jgi:hypothetical protein
LAVAVTRASLSVLLAVPLAAQSADRLARKNVSIAQINYKGRSAIHVVATPEAANAASYEVRRNHSTQYSAYPNFDFARSRQEAPEK